MAPMGRRLKKGDYILLPKGSSAPPQDGIVYAQIMDIVPLDQLNKFNASISKRKLGFRVQIFTNDDTETIMVDIPKTYPLIQYCSTELEVEIVERPKEYLGMFVGRGLEDQDGTLFINYGQVKIVALRNGVSYCTVEFRQLPNGDKVEDIEFVGDELMDFEVSLLQYTMGLGVEVPFACADRRITTFRSVLDSLSKEDDHAQWIKQFRSISPAHPEQKILDQFLESVEINIPKIIGNWSALSQYLPEVKVKKSASVKKDLQVDFNMDADGFGECLTGHPVTPIRVADSLHSQNQRRQEYRGSVVPQVIPLTHAEGRNGRVAFKDQLELQRQELSVEVQQVEDPSVSLRRLSLSPSESEQVQASHVSNYSKHGYHPTGAQLQKHKITFKTGAYGKSYTLAEASSGIEEVLTQELMFAVKSDEAHVRAWCIMMGDLMVVPWGVWRNATLLANNFEEHYMPVKWNKLPELKALEVNDMDDFWNLYLSMEEAASRYYVDSYVSLLARVRVNLNKGFMVVGGRSGFNGLRVASRRNVIHILVAYMRLLVNRFIGEVLSTGASPGDWMAKEATATSPLYEQHVRIQLTNLQLSDFSARANGNGGGGGGSGNGGGGAPQPRKEGEWTSKMPTGMHGTIPKEEGKNMCLMSYTRQGCKKDGCKFQHKKAGSPGCPAPLREWIESTYGSYVAPQ